MATLPKPVFNVTAQPLAARSAEPRTEMDQMVFRLFSTPTAVREGLREMMQRLMDNGADQELCDRAEMVLAEALNNVVEHAYSGKKDGWIEIAFHHREALLKVRMVDKGSPMPGLTLPEGRVQDLSVDMSELPEGGFGWLLIRTLTKDLVYDRRDGANLLTFSLAAEDNAD